MHGRAADPGRIRMGTPVKDKSWAGGNERSADLSPRAAGGHRAFPFIGGGAFPFFLCLRHNNRNIARRFKHTLCRLLGTAL